jgi:hypothetical protein
MTNTARLDNIAHANLHVMPHFGPAYGDAVNQLLIFPTEFQAVQREFPILFSRDAAGAFQAVAIVGLERDQNLFLTGDKWNARYIPAVQRRGPFVIGFRDSQGGDREPVILVDLDDPRVRMGPGTGLPIFLPHGGNAPYLEEISAVLRMIHIGHAANAPMFECFEELGLVEPVSLQLKLSDSEQIDMQDYFTIPPERLAALSSAALDRLNKAGLLATAIHVGASLDNFVHLIERRNRLRSEH